MDFKFSEEDEAFRQEFRSWLEKNLPRDWRDDGEEPDPETKSEFERRRAWHRKLDDGGWMCIHWPKEYGGRGATLLQQIIYSQELDHAKAPRSSTSRESRGSVPTLMQWGTPEQKKRYIPGYPPPRRSGARDFRSPITDPTSPRLKLEPWTRATTSSSTVRRSGPRMRIDADMSTLLCRTDPDRCPSIRG